MKDELPFETTEEQLIIEGRSFRIRHVSDSDALFERLLNLPEDHPDVKDERIPYWAEVWPAAIGLAEHVIRYSNQLIGKDVLEIGCGLGLPGIVAGCYANQVVMTDYLSEAVSMAEHNWQLNHTHSPLMKTFDWRSCDPSLKASVILASDVAYEQRMFFPLLSALHDLLSDDGVVWLSEPDRHFARVFFDTLDRQGFSVEHKEHSVVRKAITYRVNVHVLKKK